MASGERTGDEACKPWGEQRTGCSLVLKSKVNVYKRGATGRGEEEAAFTLRGIDTRQGT